MNTMSMKSCCCYCGKQNIKESSYMYTLIVLCFHYRTSELVTAVAGVLQKEPCRASFRQLLISRLPDLLSAFAEEVKGIRADFKVRVCVCVFIYLYLLSSSIQGMSFDPFSVSVFVQFQSFLKLFILFHYHLFFQSIQSIYTSLEKAVIKFLLSFLFKCCQSHSF